MRCPYCGAWLENSLHKALKDFRFPNNFSITNLDYLIEVENKISVIIEEKHTYNHKVKTHQLITIKRVAKALNSNAIVVFVNDDVNELIVYEIPLDVKFPSKRFYNFESVDPIFIGDFEQFGRWIMKNFVFPYIWRW